LIFHMALNDIVDKAKTNEPAAEQAEAILPAKKKKKRRWPVIVIVAVAVLALILILPRVLGLKRQTMTTGAFATQTVAKGDITVTLSGSGTLQPADSYTITSLISGDILTAPFEEGDTVQKDAVLYTVDSSDVQGSYEQSVNAVGQAQSAYNSALKQLDDLNLKAGGTGIVAKLNVKAGDTVTAGQTIGTVRDSSVLTLKVLYQREYAKSLSVGQQAFVYSINDVEHYDGVITNISAVDVIPYDNVIAREVTIEVKNPGALKASLPANAVIGGISSLEKSQLEYKYEGNLIAPAAGKVEKIVAPEGTRVTSNQVVVILQSDTVDQQVAKARDALADARSSLNTQQNRVGDYTITSPISGTIVQKDIKAGDTMKSGTALCTVFDLSYLQLVLNVDELDIKKVQPGQSVTIKADAAPGETFTGVVTKVNINGTTQNGVTSYPVTIKIENTSGLLPGMNVDATLVVEELKDVITVPVSAVVRNNFVYVQSSEAGKQPSQPGVPAGFTAVEVTLGASNDDSIVVTGGLKEGDVIAVMDNTPSSYDMNPFMAENRVERAENGPPPQQSSGGSSSSQKAQNTAGEES
jgi:HlyD family secretion protein